MTNIYAKKLEDTFKKQVIGHWYKPFEEEQIGGDHYLKQPFQPLFIIEMLNLGFASGNVLKYLIREKNGIEDLRKAYSYIEMLYKGFWEEPRPMLSKQDIQETIKNFIMLYEGKFQDDRLTIIQHFLFAMLLNECPPDLEGLERCLGMLKRLIGQKEGFNEEAKCN